MINSHAHTFVLHGTVILLAGLLGGYWHAKAIRQKQNEVPWRVVHSGGSMGGVMLIAMSWALQFVTLPTWGFAALTWTNIPGTYLLVIAMIIAAATGQRGLTSDGPTLNKLINLAYVIGAVLSLAGAILLLIGLLRS